MQRTKNREQFGKRDSESVLDDVSTAWLITGALSIDHFTCSRRRRPRVLQRAIYTRAACKRIGVKNRSHYQRTRVSVRSVNVPEWML